MRSAIKTGLVILAVTAVAMGGLALAQTDDGPPPATDRPAVDPILERLAPLVADGTITQEQAEAVAEVLRPVAVRAGVGRALSNLRDLAGLAAEVIGIEPQQLAEELGEGRTLAEIAADHGSSRDELIAELTAAVESQIDQAVADGRLDAEQGAQAKDRLQRRIPELVDRVHPFARAARDVVRGAVVGFGLNQAGRVLDIAPDELRDRLADGESLADVVAAAGLSDEEFIEEMLAVMGDRIDRAVDAGRITDQQAATMVNRLQQAIERALDS